MELIVAPTQLQWAGIKSFPTETETETERGVSEDKKRRERGGQRWL